EFRYALARPTGADPARAPDLTDFDTAIPGPFRPDRFGEPQGEMGLVNQHDHGLWQQQAGPPTDPQAGNIPGGRRDVRRSADFQKKNLAAAFIADSGAWSINSADGLQAAAGGDAVDLFQVDSYIPNYFEVAATLQALSP